MKDTKLLPEFSKPIIIYLNKKNEEGEHFQKGVYIRYSIYKNKVSEIKADEDFRFLGWDIKKGDIILDEIYPKSNLKYNKEDFKV